MKVLSLYQGAGGIDEGLRQAGINTTLAIDTNKDACKTLKYNHPDCEVINGQVEDFITTFSFYDIIVGGPPCQDFSCANTGRTFNLTHVKLFWKIIDRIKPKYYLMENVPDLFIKFRKKSSILINCADYGVPQTRKRRIWSNLPIPQTTHAQIPTTTFNGRQLTKWVSVKKALGLEGILFDKSIPSWNKSKIKSTDVPSRTILTDNSANGILFIEDRKSVFGPYHKRIFRHYSIDRPAMTILTEGGRYWLINDLKNRNSVMYRKHKPNVIDKPAQTVTAKVRTNPTEFLTDGKYARKLTNHELQILQGFPGDYKFIGGKTSIRRQIGNALPPAITKAYFEQIKVIA